MRQPAPASSVARVSRVWRARGDSVKLGDLETRVSREAVPNKHDAKLLMHLTADLKQDNRSDSAGASARSFRNECVVQNCGHRPQRSSTRARA